MSTKKDAAKISQNDAVAMIKAAAERQALLDAQERASAQAQAERGELLPAIKAMGQMQQQQRSLRRAPGVGEVVDEVAEGQAVVLEGMGHDWRARRFEPAH